MQRAVAAGVAGLAAAVAAYGAFEAGWLRRRVLQTPVAGLPADLDGIRIAHLSDFHLGHPSRGRIATEQAVGWVSERRPDLVCITGDLVSHPRGEPLLRRVLERLGSPLVVLGNHDVAITRDPFSRRAELADLATATLLRDAAAELEVRGRHCSVAGLDPLSFRSRRVRPETLVDPAAALRVLLCHFPDVQERLPAGAFHLTLAGHLHAGQIALPLPGRRVTLAHPRARRLAGAHRTPSGTLHISPGLGTTFVPLRFCARPEVTELVLRCVD